MDEITSPALQNYYDGVSNCHMYLAKIVFSYILTGFFLQVLMNISPTLGLARFILQVLMNISPLTHYPWPSKIYLASVNEYFTLNPLPLA